MPFLRDLEVWHPNCITRMHARKGLVPWKCKAITEQPFLIVGLGSMLSCLNSGRFFERIRLKGLIKQFAAAFLSEEWIQPLQRLGSQGSDIER